MKLLLEYGADAALRVDIDDTEFTENDGLSSLEIIEMHNNQTGGQPLVQVLEVKPISSGGAQAQRYRLIISDGQHFMQAMLATQMNHLVAEQQVCHGRLIALHER